MHATDVIEQLCGGARYPKLAELDRRIKYLQCWIHEYEQTPELRKLDGAPATLTVLRDMLAVYDRLRDREITVDDANQRLEALEAALDRAASGDR